MSGGVLAGWGFIAAAFAAILLSASLTGLPRPGLTLLMSLWIAGAFLAGHVARRLNGAAQRPWHLFLQWLLFIMPVAVVVAIVGWMALVIGELILGGLATSVTMFCDAAKVECDTTYATTFGVDPSVIAWLVMCAFAMLAGGRLAAWQSRH